MGNIFDGHWAVIKQAQYGRQLLQGLNRPSMAGNFGRNWTGPVGPAITLNIWAQHGHTSKGRPLMGNIFDGHWAVIEQAQYGR